MQVGLDRLQAVGRGAAGHLDRVLDGDRHDDLAVALEEVLAALRGGIIEETDSDRDPSVADTESESPALEDQEESGSSNEQDPNKY